MPMFGLPELGLQDLGKSLFNQKALQRCTCIGESDNRYSHDL